MGTSEIRCQLHAIMLFALSLSAGLNKALRSDIIDEALPDLATMTDLDFDTSALSSSANTYGREEVESMLGYVEENITVCATWPKIQREVAEIKTAQTNWLKHSLAIALQRLGPPFLGRYDIESIKAPVITPGPESELGQLYEADLRME